MTAQRKAVWPKSSAMSSPVTAARSPTQIGSPDCAAPINAVLFPTQASRASGSAPASKASSTPSGSPLLAWLYSSSSKYQSSFFRAA